jgi:peptide/nickel transport system substrate-binding protein
LSLYGTDRRSFLQGAGVTVAAATLGVPLLSSCSGSKTSGSNAKASVGKPVRGGKAVLAIQDTPVNMDPADGQLYASLQVYQNIFSELIKVDADYTYKPNLAASWKQEDAKTWSFELVDNAFFHNGEPVTSQDVKFTIQRMKTHPLGVYLQFFDSVEVIDKQKFRIHLAKPFGAMEATLATLIDITNEKGINSGNPQSNPIGSGPYKLEEWAKGSHITLSRFDKYFKADQPYLDQVTFRSVSDNTVRLTGLQTGQFDWIQTVPPQQISMLQKSTSIDHTSAGAFQPYLFLLNTTAPPFNDIRVRQAVSWAIDRAEIVKLAFFGSALEATEAISPPNPFYTGIDPYKGGPDLDKAKSLLSQAGHTSIDTTFLVPVNVPEQLAMAQVLQSQLKKININLNIQTVASSEWFGLISKGKYGITPTYFSVSLDPGLAYYLLGYSSSAFNFAGLKSPRIDGLLDKFMFEPDQKVRKQVYPEVVTAFAEEAAVIFVANQQQQYWTRPNVHGAQPLPSLELRLEDMWKS